MEKGVPELFHKLQQQNIKPEHIHLLKQQHTYLEKLKQQRIKIQQLTNKHQTMEKRLIQKEADYIILEEKFIEKSKLLDSVLIELEEVKRHQENTILLKQKNLQHERESINQEVILLNQALEEMRNRLKDNEMFIASTQTKYQRKISEMVDEHQWELKQLAFDYQKKYENNHKLQAYEKEVEDFKKLVDRQNKALKAQDNECLTLTSLNLKLQEQVNKRNQENAILVKDKNQFQTEVYQLRQKIEVLARQNKKQMQEYRLYIEMEELRKKMGKAARDQIERIEELVNELE